MKLLVSIVAVFFAISFATSAFLPESSERKDNVIVPEVTGDSDSDRRDGQSSDNQEDNTFEIIVPVARNFSSLEELFRILKEDDAKEPSSSTGPAPTYVKGTERNLTDYLIFFTDSAVKGSST